MSKVHEGKSFALLRTVVDTTIAAILVVIVFQMMLFITDRISHGRQYGANEKGFEHVDFINFYMAGKIAASSERKRIYDAELEQQVYNEIIAPAKTYEHCFYHYPPYVFLIAEPFTLLNLDHAFEAFDFGTAAAGLAGLLLLMRGNKDLGMYDYVLILVAALGIFPSLDNLRDGQFAWAFAALFAFYFWAFVKKRDALAGLCLGMMAIKPHYLLFLMVGALIGRRYKLIVVALSVVLALCLSSAISFGPDSVLSYPALLRKMESSDSSVLLVPERMICLRGPLSLFISREACLAIGIVTFLFGLLLVAYYWFLAQVRKSIPLEWAMALTIMVLLIASPHTLVYDATVIVVAAALTLKSARLTRMFESGPASFKIWNFLLLMYPILSWVIMIFVPKIVAALLDPRFQSVFAVNGSSFGLTSFPCYLLLHIALLVSGSIYVLSGAAKVDLQSPLSNKAQAN
ncbi:MAG TPA: glycosyltransferase family 87 protein [Drouetiella sp.]